MPGNTRNLNTGGPFGTEIKGQAVFQLNQEDDELGYKLIVANIENVLQAHIHCGEAGVNGGPVVAFLYPSAPPAVLIPGKFSGVLATGTVTGANVVVRL